MVTRNQNLDQHMNWFDRQFLRAQDFADESDYQIDRLRRHLRTLHTAGVAEGLAVHGQPGDAAITIDPGTAIDDQGREIVLITAPPPIPLPASATTAELYVIYSEAQTNQSQDPGITGYTRITEIPTFSFRETAPGSAPVPADGVLLAQLSISTGQLASAPDTSVQTGAGAAIANVAAFSVTLKRVGQPATAWPRLTSSGPNQVGLAGDLSITGQGSATGALSLPGPLTLGDVALTAPGAGKLSVAGDLHLTSQGSATGALNVPGALALGGGLTLGAGLQFGTDAPVTAISRDGTLAADRGTAVPTEAAVKTYADAVKVYAGKAIGVQAGTMSFNLSLGQSQSQTGDFGRTFASNPAILVATVDSNLTGEVAGIQNLCGYRLGVPWVSETQVSVSCAIVAGFGGQINVAWLAFGPLA